MPREITIDDLDKKLIERTHEIYKRRSGDFIKFKLRTTKTLYTVKARVEDADEVEKKIKSLGNIDIVSE